MPSNAVDWRPLLEAAVAAHPRGKAGVAGELGVKRSYVSRALATGISSAGFPQGVPEKFIERVIGRYHRVACPAKKRDVSPDECVTALAPCPTSSPRDARHWRACQACPNKPREE